MLRRSIAALVVAGLLVPAAPAVAATVSSAVVEDFEASPAAWFVAAGSGSIERVTTPRTTGTSALSVDYDVTTASLQLAPRTSQAAPELRELPRRFSVDVRGDASWNVLYLQLRDATGEIFHYRMGNLDTAGWETFSVEPGRSSPATTLGGDGDAVLDLPIHVFRLVLDRNPGGTSQVSTFTLDRLAWEYEAWSPLRATPDRFVPTSGQRGQVTVGIRDPGDVTVVLTDESARVRTFAASAAGSGELAFSWDGRDDAGAAMAGSIRARLTIARSGGTWRYDVPYLAGLPLRHEPTSPGSMAGINSAMTALNTSDRASAEWHARLMEGAWIRMARESFDWNRLEPRKGWFDWAKFDQAVAVARAHNVDIVGRLEYSAGWASSAPSTAPASDRAYYPPASNADFAAYARAVVHRYKDRITTWEIWNEPNLAAFWKPAPSAAAYAALVKAASAAIKAEDPSATVVSGGTVGFDRAFADGLVAAGAWGSIDGLGVHAYVGPQPESSQLVTWLDNARAWSAGNGGKPIWLTEFGWSTYAGSGSSYIGVTETRQAEYLARAYLLLARAGVRGAFAYNLVEHGTSSTSKLDNYGLVELGGRQKPAYAALRRVAEALDQATVAGTAAPNAATRTTVDPMDTAARWKAMPLGGGSATLGTSSTRHGGTGSVQLDYSFTSSSSGVELVRNLAVPGTPSTVSVWVHGDASANPVYVKIADSTGETFQAAVGALLPEWQRLTLYMDGADINWKVSGGDGDRKVDYPITIRSLFVFRGGIGKLSGRAWFDDLQVEAGPRVRGVVVSRRNGISQALYTLGPAATATVPISGPDAWRVDGASSTRLTVSAGRVTVGLSTLPVNVLSGTELAPPVISPNGDGAADSAVVRWIAGDRTTYSFQVIDRRSGAVVRTIAARSATDAGLRSLTWDGRIGGVPAAPGAFRVRIAVHGPNGAVSYLLKDVTVE